MHCFALLFALLFIKQSLSAAGGGEKHQSADGDGCAMEKERELEVPGQVKQPAWIKYEGK